MTIHRYTRSKRNHVVREGCIISFARIQTGEVYGWIMASAGLKYNGKSNQTSFSFINGKVNLFPELPAGLSIVYSVSKNPKKGKVQRKLTFRIYAGINYRFTMHFNRDNYVARYNEAVDKLIGLGMLTRSLADRFTGVPPWEEILTRFGLVEKATTRYDLMEPEGWIDPQLNRLKYRSEHKPRKRENY